MSGLKGLMFDRHPRFASFCFYKPTGKNMSLSLPLYKRLYWITGSLRSVYNVEFFHTVFAPFSSSDFGYGSIKRPLQILLYIIWPIWCCALGKKVFFCFIDLVDQTKGYVASPNHTDSLFQLYCRSSSISTAKMNLCRKN